MRTRLDSGVLRAWRDTTGLPIIAAAVADDGAGRVLTLWLKDGSYAQSRNGRPIERNCGRWWRETATLVMVRDDDLQEAKHLRIRPIELGLRRATGDEMARVVRRDETLWLFVWSRAIPASEFVTERVRVCAGESPGPAVPFEFLLPRDDDPRWREHCPDCGELFVQQSTPGHDGSVTCGGPVGNPKGCL